MEHVGNERRLYLPPEKHPNLPEERDAIPYYDVKHGHFGSIPQTSFTVQLSFPHLA